MIFVVEMFKSQNDIIPYIVRTANEGELVSVVKSFLEAYPFGKVQVKK